MALSFEVQLSKCQCIIIYIPPIFQWLLSALLPHSSAVLYATDLLHRRIAGGGGGGGGSRWCDERRREGCIYGGCNGMDMREEW